MDIIALYHKYIYDRYNSLLKSGKEDFDNKDLSKIFEYYTAIKLSEQYGQLFYEYNEIDPNFKELNQMSKNDSGVDLCNLVDTIVQCKLRKQHLNWRECSTFFASQNIFNDETNLVQIRWPKLIIARNSECKLSSNLSIKNKLFTDITYDRDELLEFCSSLFGDQKIILEKEDSIKPKEEIILRDYQTECIELIRSDKNVIIQLPTGCGKNLIITQYIITRLYSKCDSENAKLLKFLILIPKIILMEQIRDEFVGLNLPDNIQIIGDGNTEFNGNKLITICVYNSIDKIDNFAQFEKIFIDEAHHIIKPEIYYNEEDTNSEYNSDDDSDDEDYPSDIDENEEDYLLSDEENSNSENEDIEEDECDIEEIKDNYLTKIRKLKKYNNNVFLSATIDQIDKYEYYSKDIRDMIDRGYLCDYNIHIPIFSGSVDIINSDTNVCKHLIQNYRNIIIYCNTKKEGIEINRIMNELLPLCSEYIDCDTKKSDRNTILDKFKSGEIPFLVNVKILVEGFNAPITKGVCFLHMPSSKTAIIQIIGRALRLHDQKTITNIILPFSNNEDEKTINNFLRILANNDYRIKQSYDKKKIGGYISLNKVESDCPEEVSGENNCEFRFTMIYDNIGKLINREEIWVQKLDILKKFLDQFNRIPSRLSKNIEERQLLSWINSQKKNYKYNQFNMKNIKIKILWEAFIEEYKNYFTTTKDRWYNNLLKLENFLEINKKIPKTSSKNTEEVILSGWLINNMLNYKNKKNIMKDGIIYEIFHNFVITKYNKYFMSNEDKWKYNLSKLKKFLEINKRRPNSISKETTEKKLGIWLSYNLNYCYKKNNMTTKEMYNMFDSFIKKYSEYFISSEENWKLNFSKLVDYIDTYNNKPSLNSSVKTEKKIAQWLASNLTYYTNNKMVNTEIYNMFHKFINEDQYRNLFLSDKNIWLNNFEKLQYYINTLNKRPNRRSNDICEQKLGKWLSQQLHNYRTKKQIVHTDKDIHNMFHEFIYSEKNKHHFAKNIALMNN